MALKAVHVSDVPNLDQVPESPSVALSSARLPKGAEVVRPPWKAAAFTVVGHRGSGMNALESPDRRMTAVKENSLLSFNRAARFPIDLVEFDVQTGGSLECIVSQFLPSDTRREHVMVLGTTGSSLMVDPAVNPLGGPLRSITSHAAHAL